MAIEYKPHGIYESPVDPERCKASVPHDAGFGFHQCLRKPWKDGWCKQHHPDSVAERRRKQALKDKQRWENSSSARLERAREKIEQLEARIDKVLAIVHGRGGHCWQMLAKVGEILEGKSDEGISGNANTIEVGQRSKSPSADNEVGHNRGGNDG